VVTEGDAAGAAATAIAAAEFAVELTAGASTVQANRRRNDMAGNGNTPENMGINTLSETENYVAWMTQEPDGEAVYHLELGQVTLHLFQEEWDEFLDLIDGAIEALEGEDEGEDE
jgi:hypothetical protein